MKAIDVRDLVIDKSGYLVSQGGTYSPPCSVLERRRSSLPYAVRYMPSPGGIGER